MFPTPEASTKSELRHKQLVGFVKELMDEIVKPLKSIQQQRAQVKAWLAPVFTDDTRKDSLKVRHKSTCNWILDRDAFKSWLERYDDDNLKLQPNPTSDDQTTTTTTRVLWLYGPAGFGKTVLCASVIEHLETDPDVPGLVLSFFCSGDTENRKHPFEILKSWVGQLLSEDEFITDIMAQDTQLQQRIEKGNNASEADQDVLWALLRTALTRMHGTKHGKRVTLVVDGYDECIDAPSKQSRYRNTEWRTHFLESLFQAVDGTGSRVLLVSRNQPDIRDVMSLPGGSSNATSDADNDTETLFKGVKVIAHQITKDDTSSDVSSFSQAVFARKLNRMDSRKRDDMAETAAEKSEGMFLWIHLLDKKLRNGATKRQLDKLISETPSGIDEAYKQEMERIMGVNDEDDVKRSKFVLKWVLRAFRPMTLGEMAEALAVSFNDQESNEYPDDDLPDGWKERKMHSSYVQNNILGPCGSLIELRKSGGGGWKLDDMELHGDRSLMAASGGTKERSESESESESESDRHSDTDVGSAGSVTDGDTTSEGGSEDGSDNSIKNHDSDTDRKYLRDWAIRIIRESEGKDEPHDDFTNERNDEADTIEGGVDGAGVEIDDVEVVYEQEITVHFVHFSIGEFLRRHSEYLQLPEESGSDFNLGSTNKDADDSEVVDHRWIAQLGLRYMGHTEFDEAARVGIGAWEDNVRFACRYPFYAYLADAWSNHVTAVHRKSTKSASRTLESALLEFFVGSQWKPWAELYEAIKYNDLSREVKEILKQSRPFNPSPIHYAALLGLANVVEQLINRGFDCNSVGGEDGTPLQTAVWKEERSVIELLLRNNASMALTPSYASTPLLSAVHTRSESLVELLLPACTQSDLDARDLVGGKSALHYACVKGCLGIVKLLVDAGANTEARTSGGRTPLAIPIEYGPFNDIVEYLLKNKTDPNRVTFWRESNGLRLMSTPLNVAAVNDRYVTAAEMLLDYGADINGAAGHLDLADDDLHVHMTTVSGSKTGEPPILQAASETALHTACLRPHDTEAMVKLLINRGADLDTLSGQDSGGGSPLHWAAHSGYMMAPTLSRYSAACVSLLLKSGASPFLTDKHGRTPYSLALERRCWSAVMVFNEFFSTSSVYNLDTLCYQSINTAARENYTPAILQMMGLINSCSHTWLSIIILHQVIKRGELRPWFDNAIDQLFQINSQDIDSTDTGFWWTPAEEQILEQHDWADEEVKDMILGLGDRFRSTGLSLWAFRTLGSVLIPIAVANQSLEVVEMLLLCTHRTQYPVVGELARDSTTGLWKQAIELAIRRGSHRVSTLLLDDHDITLEFTGNSHLAVSEKKYRPLKFAAFHYGQQRSQIIWALIRRGAFDFDWVPRANRFHFDALPATYPGPTKMDEIAWLCSVLRGRWTGPRRHSHPPTLAGDETKLALNITQSLYQIKPSAESSAPGGRPPRLIFSGTATLEDGGKGFELQGQIRSNWTITLILLALGSQSFIFFQGWLQRGDDDDNGGRLGEQGDAWRMQGYWRNRGFLPAFDEPAWPEPEVSLLPPPFHPTADPRSTSPPRPPRSPRLGKRPIPPAPPGWPSGPKVMSQVGGFPATLSGGTFELYRDRQGFDRIFCE